MELWEIWKIAGPILAVGGAWGGAKAALNGTRDRVKKLEKRTDDQDGKLIKVGESLVRIETKQDILLKRIDR
jgi:hypothetical protein